MRVNLLFCASALLTLSSGLLTAPVAAWQPVPIDIGPVAPVPDPEPQGDAEATEPDEGRLLIDILAQVEREMSPGEEIAYEACLAEQDAARLRGEIIVCRRRAEDGADYSGFDKEEWERDYARRTQGVKTPNVAGAGGTIIMPGEGSLISVTVTQKFGGPPEKALIIDVGALPEAPAGSDADRIARGLAPLSGD
jgi:hypothetical protein